MQAVALWSVQPSFCFCSKSCIKTSSAFFQTPFHFSHVIVMNGVNPDIFLMSIVWFVLATVMCDLMP